MIPKLRQTFLSGEIQRSFGRNQKRFEIFDNFFFCITENCPVYRIERDIQKVVERRKNAGVAELCDPRHEEKSETPVVRLHGCIKARQLLLNTFKKFSVIQMSSQRSIIFVNQDLNFPPI